jgi:glutamine amidotransferase
MKKVIFLDTGIGNKASLMDFVEHLGFNVVLTNSLEQIQKSKKLVLFGVGSFDACMKNVREIDKFEEFLKDKIAEEKIHVLGICLGMQILYEKSAEGEESGLSLLTGSISKLNYQINFPVPHIGWNTIQKMRESPLLDNVSDEKEFFFSHSYANTQINSDCIGVTTYGKQFTSIVQYKSVFGCQFHPEKSYSAGKIFMKNFLEL